MVRGSANTRTYSAMAWREKCFSPCLPRPSRFSRAVLLDYHDEKSLIAVQAGGLCKRRAKGRSPESKPRSAAYFNRISGNVYERTPNHC